MGSLSILTSTTPQTPISYRTSPLKPNARALDYRALTRSTGRPIGRPPCHFKTIARPFSRTNFEGFEDEEESDQETLVVDLRVPDHWLVPSMALQESEWLRVTLHRWLDDEYCPEPTNIEISKLAACSYYESLVAKEADLGEILLKMVRDLESLSFQESFHGVFSSANAAVNLITQRVATTTWEQK